MGIRRIVFTRRTNESTIKCEKSSQFMLARPESKWEIRAGNYTVLSTGSTRMELLMKVPFHSRMTHSRHFSPRPERENMFPRAVFVDLEPSVIDSVRNGQFK